MGERWTIIRDSLGEDPPGVIAWLRKQLHSLGPFFDPIRSGPPHTRLPYFADAYDSAIVALMQASSLCEQRDFVARAVRAGASCLETDNKGTALMHVGEYAIGIERLLAAFAWRIDPQLHGESTLTDSIKALRKGGALPLTDSEFALWDSDARWVKEQVKARRGQTQTDSPSKMYARLWQRRFEDRLGDDSAKRKYPRYLALVELMRLRNAYAHRRSSGLLGFSRPDQVWRRITGLLAMICVRAFARGVLGPPPSPEVGAVTISRSPAAAIPVPEPEPLIAYAQPVEEHPPRRRVSGSQRPPKPAPPKRRKKRKKPAAKPARRGRRWLLVTGAATVAVLVGTVGANLLAPQALAPATGSPAVATARLPEPTTGTSEPSRPTGSALVAPPLATLAPRSSGNRPVPSPRSETKQCRIARGFRGRVVGVPAVKVVEPYRRNAQFDAPRKAGQIGTLLRDNQALGPVIFLETGWLNDPGDLLRQIEASACEGRDVLTAEEALGPGELTDDALVVAEVDGAEDPRLRPLLDLAGPGRRPRVVITLPEAPAKRPLRSSLLATMPLDCRSASHALASLSDGPDLRHRVDALGLFRGAAGSDECATPPILTSQLGVQVVAAALLQRAVPPADSVKAWPWTEWVAWGAEGEEMLPPRVELARRARALEIAEGVDLDLKMRKRRQKRCAEWAREHGEAFVELGLARHVAGTEPGRRCLLWLIEGAARAPVSTDGVVEQLSLGLGEGAWRESAVREAREDEDWFRPSSAGKEVLMRLADAE